jgi:hypothetical protein
MMCPNNGKNQIVETRCCPKSRTHQTQTNCNLPIGSVTVIRIHVLLVNETSCVLALSFVDYGARSTKNMMNRRVKPLRFAAHSFDNMLILDWQGTAKRDVCALNIL